MESGKRFFKEVGRLLVYSLRYVGVIFDQLCFQSDFQPEYDLTKGCERWSSEEFVELIITIMRAEDFMRKVFGVSRCWYM